MALFVEDGSGMAAANAYASVAAADGRMTMLGLSNWIDLSNTEKEQAIARATAYMEQAYRGRWSGTRLLRAQALSWPRYGVSVDGYAVASDVVPTEVVNACIDLAFKAAAGDLNADTGPQVIRKKVGPLETEYNPNGPRSTQYRAIDMALAPYLSGGGASARLVRT